jgi:hypothetical protein
MNVLVLDKIENVINLGFFCPPCFLGEDGFDLLKFQPSFYNVWVQMSC